MKNSTEYACSQLKKYSSVRKRKKQYENDKFYVAPKALAIGTRFEMRKISSQSAAPTRLQCSFSYISIVDTLKALFKNQQFLLSYLNYNQYGGNGHECKPNEYIDFCCGNIYRKRTIYHVKPNALQIQLYQDDFEVCVPIGSKATIHKICGIYFAIRNWPNNSRLEHIYLVALCNTDDLKTPSTDFNNIWNRVVEDISVLENDGLRVNDALTLYGSLATICADNLGANTSLGFAESFTAAFYCRICELSKKECQSSFKENRTKLRSIEKYNRSLQALKQLTKVDYVLTKGVKRICNLNTLKYFHTVENICVDIMHDLSEGVLPYLLKCIINYLITKQILTMSMIVSKIQFFDYGKLNRKNAPSMLIFDKQNLNQNASQSLCLFRHFPFIFFDQKSQLNDIWECMTSMQKIIQIIYSRRLCTEDLRTLSEEVYNHLRCITSHFDVRPIPKHHNLTHYATVIEAVGPLRNHTTIRFEAKHQEFKQFAKNTKNFKNLTLTLASKHQRKAARSIKNFQSIRKISTSGKTNVKENIVEFDIAHTLVYEHKFVLVDDRKFQKGLFILHENGIYEIEHVLESVAKYSLLCVKYQLSMYNDFLNSYKIKRSSPREMSQIFYEQFQEYDLFEKKVVGESIYIIAQSMEIEHVYNVSNSNKEFD